MVELEQDLEGIYNAYPSIHVINSNICTSVQTDDLKPVIVIMDSPRSRGRIINSCDVPWSCDKEFGLLRDRLITKFKVQILIHLLHVNGGFRYDYVNLTKISLLFKTIITNIGIDVKLFRELFKNLENVYSEFKNYTNDILEGYTIGEDLYVSKIAKSERLIEIIHVIEQISYRINEVLNDYDIKRTYEKQVKTILTNVMSIE
jgi:hypothetical protein